MAGGGLSKVFHGLRRRPSTNTMSGPGGDGHQLPIDNSNSPYMKDNGQYRAPYVEDYDSRRSSTSTFATVDTMGNFPSGLSSIAESGPDDYRSTIGATHPTTYSYNVNGGQTLPVRGAPYSQQQQQQQPPRNPSSGSFRNRWSMGSSNTSLLSRSSSVASSDTATVYTSSRSSDLDSVGIPQQSQQQFNPPNFTRARFAPPGVNLNNGIGGNGGGGRPLGPGGRRAGGGPTPGPGSGQTRTPGGAGGNTQQKATANSAEIRRCIALLRKMFELRIRIWSTHRAHWTHQPTRDAAKMQAEDLLQDIHAIVRGWREMPPGTWTDDEWNQIMYVTEELKSLQPFWEEPPEERSDAWE